MENANLKLWLQAGTFLALTLAFQQAGFSQTQAPGSDAGLGGRVEDARAMLEGTFVLDEWNIGGKSLRPPEVDGRFSIHDGVILFMTTRNDGAATESVHGWGVYSITADGWTYGYRHLETVRGPADGPLTRTLAAPSSSLLKLHWEGPKLIVVGKGSDRREYSRDTFVSAIGSAGDFRRWRRIQ
jgi:hypothetical protein